MTQLERRYLAAMIDAKGLRPFLEELACLLEDYEKTNQSFYLVKGHNAATTQFLAGEDLLTVAANLRKDLF